MPSKRKSWLPFSKAKADKSTGTTEAAQDAPPPSAFKDPDANNTDRLRPIQFSPNRLQTLYVTPSERNLYLAAMSQLDENPPHLALWSDPAPSLPHINTTQAIPSPIDEGGGWPDRLPQPPAPVPAPNPKLMTSPEARTNGGLMVREEFRRLAPAKQVQYATIALTGAGGVRFTRFPANVLVDLEKLFPPNKVVTESAEGLMMMRNGVVPFWKVKMFGSMWKRTGAEELDPIRLLISIVDCLGTHGWTIVNSIRAGGQKTDVQNLLFTYSPDTAINPPAYFALSFPVPDRISLISPPPKATPALLSSIRNAITSTSAGHSRSGTGNSADSHESKKRVSWNDKKAKIKVEGWVYDGVYRFWLDGLRRKIVGGVKKDAVEFLQPHVVLHIISALSSLHYTLAGSIPLQPVSAGRDILLFASQPDTGVAAKDAYKPKARETSPIGSDGSESPVLVQRTSSFPVPDENSTRDDPRAVDPERRVLPWTSTVHGQKPTQHNRSVSEDQQGPNISSSRSPSAQAKIQNHRRNASLDSTQAVIKPQSSSVQSSPRPRNVLLKKNSIRRQTSNSSTVNAKPPSQSQAPRSRRASDATGVNTRREEPGRRNFTAHGGNPSAQQGADVGSWMMVDPPAKVGHMGLTMYTDPNSGRQTTVKPGAAEREEQETHHIPAPQITALGHIPAPQITALGLGAEGGVSQDGHSSGDSIYETPSANVPLSSSPSRDPPRLPPRPQQPYIAPQVPQAQYQQLNTPNLPLPLGNPIARDEVSQVSSIPSYLPLKSPRSPNRVNQAERVDIGIPSVHGSLGYMPSMMSFAPSTHDPMPSGTEHSRRPTHETGGDFDPNDQEKYDDILSHMPGGLALGEDRKGKGKEGARRVWDEERGVWVDGITPKSIGPDGPGSARTRVSIN